MPHKINERDKEHGEGGRDVPFYKSDLEDVDFALFNFVDEQLNISTNTNKGFKKVPVVWAGSERAHSIKNSDISRDKIGMVTYPIIAIERSSVNKNVKKRTIPYAMVDPIGDLKGGTITVNKIINQKKTSAYANADSHRLHGQENFPRYKKGRPIPTKNSKIVYETITLPLPVYVELGYKIYLRTEYQQQMNDLLTPFIRVSNAHRRIKITHNQNIYEAFIKEEYTTTNKIINYESNERIYETVVGIDALGYLIGDGNNQNRPRVVRRENAVDVRIARETVIIDTEDGEFRF